MSVKLLKTAELAKLFGVTTTSIRRWVAAETFPPPVTIGKGTIRFVEADVEKWLARKRKANSTDPEILEGDVVAGELHDLLADRHDT